MARPNLAVISRSVWIRGQSEVRRIEARASAICCLSATAEANWKHARIDALRLGPESSASRGTVSQSHTHLGRSFAAANGRELEAAIPIQYSTRRGGARTAPSEAAQ